MVMIGAAYAHAEDVLYDVTMGLRHRVSGISKKSAAKPREEQRSKRGKHGQSGGDSSRTSTLSYKFWIVGIAVATAVAHSAHLHVLFENDRFFSHLSPLERELSFPTEMGLYYSYYKTLVTSPSLADGLHQITHDNLTEYPSVINTLQRFNLYPELVLGILYRSYSGLLSVMGASGVECHTISRGLGQPPISTCNGLGDACYMYVWCVFALNGLMTSLLFLLGVYLSDSIVGGLLSLLAFFYNHGEATRVMWTPPLRESFAMPFFILQMLMLTYILRHQSPGLAHGLILSLSSLTFMLPWQFAQFTLLTQLLSVLIVYVAKLISVRKFQLIIISMACALIANIILQFGNTLLLTSYLPTCLLACLLVSLCHPLFFSIPWLPVKMVCEVSTVLSATVILKTAVSFLLPIKDDAHIGAILLSKFTSYKDFHTQLYTCSAEFDFLPLDYLLSISSTLLLPGALFVVAVIGVAFINYLLKSDHTPNLAEYLYHVLQCLSFAVMAILIMRLKLFLTPQLTVLISLLAAPKLTVFLSGRGRLLLLALLMFGSSLKGVYNLWDQWNILGEFNNPDQERLVHWVNSSLPNSTVFAGSMPTMATMKLTTSRAIVNHPHYEDAGLRNRTQQVYTIYSRKPATEVHSILNSLQVTHVIVEDAWCFKRYRPGCAFSEVWDQIDPGNQDRPAFCELLADHIPEQFKLVYSNRSYRVLQLVT